jgi:hypothetical protein
MSINPLVGQLIGAIVGLAGGWKYIEPRFQRLTRRRNEAGEVEVSLWVLYCLPQFLNVGILIGFVFFLFAALIGALENQNVLPASITSTAWATWIVSTAYKIGWALLLIVLLGILAIWTDFIARVFVNGARLLSLLPVPGLRGRFGADGDSIGWHQAREFLRNQGEADLFWIDAEGVRPLADAVLARMAADPSHVGKDRAPTPATADRGVRANIALFGCIIESMEHANKVGHDWDVFYDALEQAHEATQLFAPEKIRARNRKSSFGQEIRESVNHILAAANDTKLELRIDYDVDQAAALLIDEYGGDASNLASGWRGKLLGPVRALYLAAAKFPHLDNDSMRPQFVKLCLRWNAIDGAEPRTFDQPFAASIAWLLLQYNALETLQENGTVVFGGLFVNPAARIASRMVIDRVVELIRNGQTTEIVRLRESFDKEPANVREWSMRQEVDTAMWTMSRDLLKRAKNEDWKDGWRWRLDQSVATRI